MNEEPGTGQVTALNLPAEALGILEAAQATRVDDLDALLYSRTLQAAVVDPDGADALGAGFLIAEVEAGYEGSNSRVFQIIGARASTSDDHGKRSAGNTRGGGRLRGITQVTTIEGESASTARRLLLSRCPFQPGWEIKLVHLPALRQ